MDEIEVIIPNLSFRYSGGTAVNRTIAPLIARKRDAVWFGPDAPEGIARLSILDLLRLRFQPPKRHRARIWHARRNDEMVVGLLLKWLGWRFALIFNSAGQRRHTAFTRFLIARMDEIIATSEISASFLERPATVIHHGIDLDAYKPPQDRAAAFAATGLPGKYGIGVFGRVRKQKGIDLFVAAMLRLLPKYPDFTAVIVGLITVDNAPFVDRLKADIAAAGLSHRIRFLGELPIQEVPAWYQRISIYVFASRVEGFGLTMLEAMAAGNAVVATRAGAAELVIEDGVTGVLAPTGDVDALSASIEPLMREPERIEGIGERARARVMDAFNRDREVAEIIGVYRKIWADE
ncbi:glycosyltransferase family 4 protein [Rhodoblastus acidophilus]|uniref:Glycosyltransferase family 4 protein n=1 Tax=Candidatus Rhodoblastus alkanivorans TaxID=2954117 RepID=A0ABS9Z3I1_9HYPH|nr:glycosyltransferase family 4 protein [Candidatus Rhodoblastus alkanivorans]MCI4677402.1 glycosyltransferase family 4 protein [Candidatus Rhodoblastus alkanivorans]MCI4682137.1 glycosyltransferase family 4 protein [Candidatus Rhodoblastus alkanivorans]MDI4639439.1 glycosyltransferase family 4 protein [Rhodoblastus acidophilus]